MLFMIKYAFIGLTLVGLLLPNAGYRDFNLEDCYGDCTGMPLRLRFGQIAHGGKQIPMAQGNYDACMQECDRKFWADFERKTKGINKKDKGK